jgi:hypothetical protein
MRRLWLQLEQWVAGWVGRVWLARAAATPSRTRMHQVRACVRVHARTRTLALALMHSRTLTQAHARTRVHRRTNARDAIGPIVCERGESLCELALEGEHESGECLPFREEAEAEPQDLEHHD